MTAETPVTDALTIAARKAAKYLRDLESIMLANDVDMRLDGCLPPSAIADELEAALAPALAPRDVAERRDYVSPEEQAARDTAAVLAKHRDKLSEAMHGIHADIRAEARREALEEVAHIADIFADGYSTGSNIGAVASKEIAKAIREAAR